MDKKLKREDEYIVIGQDGKETVDVPVLVEYLLIKLMGKALDCTRMSDISDRQLKQLERSVKDSTYDLAAFGKVILTKYGKDK